jgi:hypothetical protein
VQKLRVGQNDLHLAALASYWAGIPNRLPDHTTDQRKHDQSRRLHRAPERYL